MAVNPIRVYREPIMTIDALRKDEGSAIEVERYERGCETIRRLCQRVGRILTADGHITVKTQFGAAPAAAWIRDAEITLAQDYISGMVSDMTDRAKVSVCVLFHE